MNDVRAMDARYARQRILHGFGIEGQTKLAQSSVLIIGAGGLGAPSSMYLAAAGVGRIGMVDTDVVDSSNLHRQLLYSTNDVGRSKLSAAEDRLREINPLVELEMHETKLRGHNAVSLIKGYDLVIDGTDNFPARYSINDACISQGIPFVYGSVSRFEGQVSIFCAPDGPCYRCLFPNAPEPGLVPSCAEDGVLGVMPGTIGLLQAAEAVKWLAGIGRSLSGRLLLLDILEQQYREIGITRDLDCPACGAGRESFNENQLSRAISCSGSSKGATMTIPENISVRELKDILDSDDSEHYQLIDVREPHEFEIGAINGAQLIPLRSLPLRVNEMDTSASYLIYCHHGGRSASAADWLRSQGFENVSNVSGGIDAWSLEIDDSVPRY